MGEGDRFIEWSVTGEKEMIAEFFHILHRGDLPSFSASN